MDADQKTPVQKSASICVHQRLNRVSPYGGFADVGFEPAALQFDLQQKRQATWEFGAGICNLEQRTACGHTDDAGRLRYEQAGDSRQDQVAQGEQARIASWPVRAGPDKRFDAFAHHPIGEHDVEFLFAADDELAIGALRLERVTGIDHQTNPALAEKETFECLGQVQVSEQFDALERRLIARWPSP